MGDKRDEIRRPILDVIAMLNEQHAKHLEPYIKRLCEIDAFYMPALRITVDELARLNLEVVELRDVPRLCENGKVQPCDCRDHVDTYGVL